LGHEAWKSEGPVNNWHLIEEEEEEEEKEKKRRRTFIRQTDSTLVTSKKIIQLNDQLNGVEV